MVEKFQIVRNYGKEKKDDMDLSSPLAILKLLSPSKPKESKNPKIAVIYAVGAIETGKGGGFLLIASQPKREASAKRRAWL